MLDCFNKNVKKLLYLFLFFSLFIFSSQAQNSPDAIAIRAVSNPGHLSPMRWYNENVSVQGSPQQLLVDGYQAVRDGRTVYVNAANVVAGIIYTNIYIISYNQRAEQSTQDIFGQILAHWRFNTNIDINGICSENAAISCIDDEECLGNGFCNSPKAEVVHNTRRLSDLSDIQKILDDYKKKLGHYPYLDSGSYLPHKTLSVWPSWQETLAKELGQGLPVDPVNKMGECLGFDSVTCWNNETQQFDGSIPNDLPAGSQVYYYVGTPGGESYLLSATTTDPIEVIGPIEITEEVVVPPPEIIVPLGSTSIIDGITYININASPGKVFSYFVDATDSAVTWSIDSGPAIGWTSMLWSDAPALNDSALPSVKEVYADTVGAEGEYFFSITIDSSAGSDTQYYRVIVTNQPPLVEINKTYTEVVAGSNSLVVSPIRVTAVDPDSHYPLMDFLAGSLPVGVSWSLVSSSTVWEYEMSGIPTDMPATTDYNYNASFTDTFGAFNSIDFALRVVNNAPVFTSVPDNMVRVLYDYYYDADATDADGHTIFYQFSVASAHPPELTIDSSTGEISGTPAVTGSYSIIIEAADPYGGSTFQSYILNVTTYCGDGMTQNPNDEGDPEQCDDGNDIETDACDSSCQWTCESLPGVDFSAGASDSMVFDTDPSPNVANQAGGDYMKVANVVPTPYIWVVSSEAAGQHVTKVRTFDGWKRLANGTLDTGAWETRGQNLGTFTLYDGTSYVTNPSRTAVNAETGEVWIAGRNSGNVAKLDIEGNVLKICATGSGPRGVAIEENGDVWVGNYGSSNVVKIPGDDFTCTIMQTVDTGGNPYGLAIDSQNNIWVSNRGSGLIQKINTSTYVVTSYSGAGDLYGMTVDIDDNIWVARYGSNGGVYKLNTLTGTVSYQYFGGWDNATGVSIDTDSGIWVAMYSSNRVINIPDRNNLASYSVYGAGTNPRGIAGDSAGQVWAINRMSDNMSVYEHISGLQVTGSPFAINVTQHPYTYSDMTGLNRAMLIRGAIWQEVFDSGYNDQHWGEFNWTENVPSVNQSVNVFLRAANIEADLDSVPWTIYDRLNPLASESARVGRFLQVKIELHSRERGVTPVFSELESLCASPKPPPLIACTPTDPGVCFGCTATCGGGTCTGTRIDDCGVAYACTITNTELCPLDCSLPENLVCDGLSLGNLDRNDFLMSDLSDNWLDYRDNDWGYTSAYLKPTVWPAAVPHGSNIVIAPSTCCYYGEIYCNDGIIYKSFASSTDNSLNICHP